MATAPANRYRNAGTLESLDDWLRRVPVGRAGRAVLKRLYHATLMIRTAGRGLRSDLPGGEVVYVSPEYRYLSWNPLEYAAFRDAVKPGAIALDVGANVGAYSLLLAQWAGPSGAVYAFEPAPEAFDGLSRHVAMNGLDATVHAVHAAVGDAVSDARFVVSRTAGEGRLAATAEEGARAITVPVTTIDDFCARERVAPDFIKIDVEGHETAVLRGARETLGRCRGKAAVFVEVHPTIWPRIGTTRAEFEDELRTQRLALVPLAPTADLFAVEGMCLRVVPR
jgi:FkbM family methyltransferase